MILRFLLATACLYLSFPLLAQDGNWKKLSKSADQLYATGNYEEAANYYLEAYKNKPSKSGFLYQVADCYSQLRFYSKSAQFYKELVDHKDFPLAGLQYARALKQNGNYEDATAAFKKFLVNYKGENSNDYIKIIKTEIDGCEYALSDQSNEGEWIVEHLGENINTMANEVAPLPFEDGILYFTSTMEGFSKIYRSHIQDGEWSKAMLPKFPTFENQHVSHGTFTPDNQRFYFTLCNNSEFDVVDGKCDIFVTVRKNSEWTKPRKLREYVKLEGTTATHPYVMFDGNTEVLYFSSDRKGGKGGMDIWFMTRHIDSPEYDFTLPKNAGNNVNTSGDEITPFYDEEEGLLYYSSNGHSSIGGFDVFKSMGSMSKFSKAQNLGRPINSSADDYYFIQNDSRTGGFVSSNRTHGSEKITTDNDDIFYYATPVKEIFARGNVYDKSNNSIVNDVQVILYEVKDSGSRRLLQSIIANNGSYQFSLIPERTFEIEFIKDSYDISTFKFNTVAFDMDKEYGKSVYLEKEAMAAKNELPVFNEAESTASVEPVLEEPRAIHQSQSVTRTAVPVTKPMPIATTTDPVVEESYVNSYYQGMEVRTTAPKATGVYYKVQISTAGFFNESDPMFDSLRGLGLFQTEIIEAKGWTRILLSEYPNLREAKEIMDEARISGFPEAFVVKYRNGNRLN